MDRKELETRIWGRSIASARTKGLISEDEAAFLLDEYLKEFKSKSDWTWQKHFGSLLGNRPHLCAAVSADSDRRIAKLD